MYKRQDDAGIEALLVIETEVLLGKGDVSLVRLRAPEGEGRVVVRAGIADTVEVAAVRQLSLIHIYACLQSPVFKSKIFSLFIVDRGRTRTNDSSL